MRQDACKVLLLLTPDREHGPEHFPCDPAHRSKSAVGSWNPREEGCQEAEGFPSARGRIPVKGTLSGGTAGRRGGGTAASWLVTPWGRRPGMGSP